MYSCVLVYVFKCINAKNRYQSGVKLLTEGDVFRFVNRKDTLAKARSGTSTMDRFYLRVSGARNKQNSVYKAQHPLCHFGEQVITKTKPVSKSGNIVPCRSTTKNKNKNETTTNPLQNPLPKLRIPKVSGAFSHKRGKKNAMCKDSNPLLGSFQQPNPKVIGSLLESLLRLNILIRTRGESPQQSQTLHLPPPSLIRSPPPRLLRPDPAIVQTRKPVLKLLHRTPHITGIRQPLHTQWVHDELLRAREATTGK